MTVSNLASPSTPPHEQLGRYRLVAQLGQGGMGTIHLAVTSGLGEFRKLLVIKELQRDLAQNDKFVEMFMAEAKLAARLNHPNIVQTVEAGEEDGRYFLAMEFLDGQPLTALLKRATIDPVVSLGTRIQILCEILAGLEYAHELCDFDGTPYQIVHRDVTPHNVFVTYHGQVKLVDFGIAKAVDVESLTTAGVFKGKFSYAAPEQVRGDQVDHRSDLFSVGVMLWEALAMRRFAAGTPNRAMVDKRLSGGEPRIAEVVPTVEPLLAEICDRAIHLDPNARYPSAATFRADLQRFLLISGETPSITLADLMQAKFAAERAAMHRVIDVQVKREERSQSSVRWATSSSQTSPDAPSRASRPRSNSVGELVRMVEAERAAEQTPSASPLELTRRISDAPAEWPGSLRDRGRLALAVGALSVLTSAAGLWLYLHDPAPPLAANLARPSGSASSSALENAAPPARGGRSEPAAAPVGSADLAPGVGGSRLPPLGETDPVAPEAPPSRAEPRGKPVPAQLAARGLRPVDSEPSRGRASSGPASPPKSGVRGVPAAERTLPARERSRPDVASSAEGAGEPAVVPPEVAAPKSAPAVTPGALEAGQDLRRLPQRSQRPIDLEDPFE